MLKQQLSQKGQQKLSPQQIKLMKLVQLSTLDFEQKVKQELEENPALEEEEENCSCSDLELEEEYEEYSESEISENDHDFDLSKDQNQSIFEFDEYLSDDEIEDFKKNVNHQNYGVKKQIPIVSGISFQEYLKNQLHTFRLNEEDLLIADFILGNIDDDGYIKRKITAIVDDILLVIGISVNAEKIEQLILNYIQRLDPVGVGSRNLQECLLIQLEKKK